MTDEYYNPFISDAVQAVHKAVGSANKNLDNALTVAVRALNFMSSFKNRKDDPKIIAAECIIISEGTLKRIAKILKVRQKD